MFKIQPYKTGDLAWVRIYSGVLEPNSRVLNSTRDKKENVAQLWRIHASKKDEQLESARAGDVVVIAGKGHEQGQEVAGSKLPFDDREVARDALRALWAPA